MVQLKRNKDELWCGRILTTKTEENMKKLILLSQSNFEKEFLRWETPL